MKLYKKQKLFKQILMKKATTCTTQNFYILLTFLLVAIVLLIAVNIYCYLIKYKSKQKFITILCHKWQIKRSFILINVL